MFDLTSFIRQLLPASRRTTLNTAFVNLLFAPIASLLLAIDTARNESLLQARGTGQVIVLEGILNQVVYGSPAGQIYILDGNNKDIDFQVIIPGGLSSGTMGQLRGLLNTYKQAGKRYAITVDSNYNIGELDPLGFEPSFPYLSSTQILVAINRSGTYHVTIDRNGTVIYSADDAFIDSVPRSYAAFDAATYTITVGSLSAVLSRDAVGVISGFTWQRVGTTLNALILVNQGDVDVKLLGRNSTVYTDDWTVGSIANTTYSGVAYNRKRAFLNISPGDYTLQTRVAGQVTVTSIDFTIAGPTNQPPVVVNPMPDQTGKVGVYFTYSIPGNVFGDPDGYIAGYVTTGLPAGITHSPGNPIAGTPTTEGASTVRVTVTDNQGATVYDEFQLVILPADSVDPPPPPPSPGSTVIIRTNSNIMNLVAESNGTKWRVRDTVNYGIPSGYHGYWYVNGQPHTDGLSTDYEYDPGDEIIVLYVIATSDDVSTSDWSTKSYAKVVFGTI